MTPRIAFLTLLVLITASVAQAQNTSERTVIQQNAAAANPAKPVKAKPRSAAAKAKWEQERGMALSLLLSLANDAKSFADDRLRARTLMRIADGLWEVDPDQGRTLFIRAWDAAETADQESARKMKEDRERQASQGRGAAVLRQPDLRSEVLRFAAKRDRALGEELLDKLNREKAEEVAEAARPGRRDFDLPEAMAQRLRLARQLIDVDIPRALQFADPALGTVTMQGLSFLSYLKEKDVVSSDQRYLRLLAASAADPMADANTVSLLSSYLFTPQIFMTIDRTGGMNTSQMGRPGKPPETTPELRNAFFRVATQILMRPLAPPEQDKTTSGIEGKYLIIKRLLPLFEQFASKDTTELIKGQMAALSASVRDEIRGRDDDMMRRGIRPEEKPENQETALLDRISRAKTSEERDLLYVELTLRTLEQGDSRARDFVDKIEDSELRKQVRPYVDVSLVIAYLEKKKTDDALNLAVTGELTHFQRVWAYTQIVKLLNELERDKALNLLGDASEEARRIDGSDADRPRALIGLANAYFSLDPNRAWELVSEAVKAANSAKGFSGEDSRLILRLQTPVMTSMRTNSAENFDLPSLFGNLTKDNYSRAEGVARNFEGDSPRATALISIARTVLNDK
ncbi:MAG TPA: hypothetical protein VGW36_00940 [Pyrinomonadaceae bacterium]|nr:hypothetical protein [Pyrinomonadaceae bacterium]